MQGDEGKERYVLKIIRYVSLKHEYPVDEPGHALLNRIKD
jgi:hypothetical protein